MSLYIAAYDITDDKARQRVAKVLLSYGTRLQKSVFEIWLEPEEIAGVKMQVGSHLDAGDRFDIIPVDRGVGRPHFAWQDSARRWNPVLLL